jgi:hypothetical protein
MLLNRIFELALPEFRKNATIPPGAEVDALVREARAVLSPITTFAATGKGVSSRAYVDWQHRIVELWVERNMPLSASDRDTMKAKRRCVAIADIARARSTRKEKTREGTDALEMVAALLDSTPAMVKKARARRFRPGGRLDSATGAGQTNSLVNASMDQK